MSILKEDLNILSIAELNELKNAIEVLIRERNGESRETFQFVFEESADLRRFPFVARLYWNAEKKKIDREFFESSKEYGKGTVTVTCEYEAKAGDIIEQRSGGSWKNEYREWYLVTERGELKQVADIDKSSQKTTVKKYLQGKYTVEEMLNELG